MIRMLLDDFIFYLDTCGKSPDTLDGYRRKIYRFAVFIGECDVETIDRDMLLAFDAALKKAGLSSTSRTSYMVALKSFFMWLENEKIIEATPFTFKIKKPRYPRRSVLSVEQIGSLFGACHNRRETLILALGLHAGLRAIEIYRLKKEDVRADALLIHGKGDHWDSQPISPPLRVALDAYFADGLAGETLIGLSRGYIRNLVIQIGQRVDIRVSSHILRHTFITHILRVSDIETARRLARHSDLRTTATYLHSDPERMESAICSLPYDVPINRKAPERAFLRLIASPKGEE